MPINENINSGEFTQDFRTQLRKYADGTTRIGVAGRLWYDNGTQSLRVSDGVTPGGIVLIAADDGASFSQSDFDSAFTAKDTDDLSEGTTNLYYTNARADARIAAASITDLSDADQTVRTTDNVTFGNITSTGYIAGPAVFTIDPAGVGDNTGKVVIAGDLQVDGTTTTINSTTVSVDDLNLTLASGAASASAANGAGITIDGASATFTYVSASDRWTMNKDLAADLVGNVTGNVTGSAGTVTSLSNRSVGDFPDVDITTAAPTNNQVLVWDNGNSKFIPGDSFNPSAITQSLLPDTDVAYDLGSATNQWRELHLSGNTIFLGGATIRKRGDGGIDFPENSKVNGRKIVFDIKDLDDAEGRIKADIRDLADIEGRIKTDINDLDDSDGRLNAGVSNYNQLTNRPTLFSGEYADLTGQLIASQIPNSIITKEMLAPTNISSQEFTANGSTTAFTLSADPGSKNAIQVFIDGVPQRASNYTVVGTTLTLGGTPVNGQVVEVRGYGIGVALPVGTVADDSITGAKIQDGTIGFDKIQASNYRTADIFTGDGNTAAYTLSTDPGSPYAVTVYVAGVWQKTITNYNVFGTTLTFTSNVPNGEEVYVRFGALSLAVGTVTDTSVTNAKLNLTYTSNQYTGDNTTTAYTIASGHTINSVLVILDGLILPPVDYSVSGTTLTFASAPLTSQSIDIRYMPV